MTGRLARAVLGAALVLGMVPAVASAAPVQLTEAQGSGFPDRTYVLSLPRPQALNTGDVRLRENGKPIADVQVVQAANATDRSFGVVLAIDSSQSMHNGAIDGAMAAARSFAARRSPGQALGVLFFNHGSRVALPLTTDAGKIDDALAASPTLAKGTRLNDATAAAISMLHQGGVTAGSVVVLSDGADVGSNLSTSAVAGAAQRAHVRVFSVGLRSPSYDPTTLRHLASAGNGSYAEAASAGELAQVFDDLASRLAGEYLVSYRSPAALGSAVRVSAHVSGLGTVKTSYVAPKLAVAAAPGSLHLHTGLWSSTAAYLIVAAVLALLIASALYLVVRPRRVTVAERIDAFTGTAPSATPARLTERQTASVLAGAERSLARTKWWPGFALDLDIARIGARPAVFALSVVVIALFTGWVVGGLLGHTILALLLTFAIIFGARRYVAFKAGRQRRQFADQLVDNLQVIVSAMRAGYSFVGALSVAVDDAAEPARTEFRRIVRDEQLGLPVEQALYEVARRMESVELEHVGLVAALQRETGGNTAEVLDRLIESVRGRSELRLLIRTLTSQGRLGGYVISALPLVLVIVLNILQPGYLTPLTDSFGGTLVLIAAGCSMAAGWVIIRKIVDIKV